MQCTALIQAVSWTFGCSSCQIVLLHTEHWWLDGASSGEDPLSPPTPWRRPALAGPQPVRAAAKLAAMLGADGQLAAPGPSRVHPAA